MNDLNREAAAEGGRRTLPPQKLAGIAQRLLRAQRELTAVVRLAQARFFVWRSTLFE